MELIKCSIDNCNLRNNGLVATIGQFDGIHIAHQILIEKVCELSEEKELKSLPKSLVIGEFPKYELNTTNFKNIYNMMNSVIKKINKTDEYFNELVVLKKVYIEIIAGENICYKK